MQLIALPLLLLFLFRLGNVESAIQSRFALAFCLALVALHAVQLVPMPPEIWTRLPGRSVIVNSYEILERERPWLPLSLSPRATWLSLLALGPTLAVFLGTAQLGYRGRRGLSLVLIGIGVASAFLGLLQLAQGPASPLRPFEYTNPFDAVGFFANRNHFAALLYSCLLLLAAWLAMSSSNLTSAIKESKFDTSVLIATLASCVILLIFISGQAMARSRAGVMLTMVALVAALLLPASGLRPKKLTMGRIAPAIILASIVFASQFGLYGILERFSNDPMRDGRIPFARNTTEAALAHMPYGSGMGTFVPIYGSYEKRADVMHSYANRAHNDLLEGWLESGIAGVTLFAVFVLWLLGRTFNIWRFGMPGGDRIDSLLARAATLVPLLLILHSVVDYPLRTAAIAAVFAMTCGLLIAPPQVSTTGRREAVGRARESRRVATPVQFDIPAGAVPLATAPLPPAAGAAPPVRKREPFDLTELEKFELQKPQPQHTDRQRPVAQPQPSQSPVSGGTWGDGMQWPDEWRKKTGDKDDKKLV